MGSATPLAAVVIAASLCLPACARERAPAQAGTGRLESTVVDIPELGGKGVWIHHDGLTVTTSEGHTKTAVPMKTPFRVANAGLLGGLLAGERVQFTYRQLRTKGFPFEVLSVTKREAR